MLCPEPQETTVEMTIRQKMELLIRNPIFFYLPSFSEPKAAVETLLNHHQTKRVLSRRFVLCTDKGVLCVRKKKE